MPELKIVLVSWAVVALIMLVAWLWALKLRNNGIVDVFWALNFAFIATIIWYFSPGDEARKWLVCALTILWSIRLSVHLGRRIFSHLTKEEGRYLHLRQTWSTTTFFVFYQAQAFSNVLLCIPFFIMARNPDPNLHLNEYIGAACWLLAVVGEGVADWQLQHFKNNPANHGRVCSVGLWNYSRHPNYFFQLALWTSVSIVALSSPLGWLSLVCPLIIGFLIFKVTGIPATEEQALRSKGEAYKNYQRTTSVFVPWFKKI